MSTEPVDTSDERLAAIQEKLLLFFAARVIDRTVRADLVGRVNVRVLERLRGTAQVDDVERFAFGVARNVLQEYWRERKRRDKREATLASTAQNIGRELTASIETTKFGRKAMLRALTECLASLGEKDRDLAERCYGEGKSKDTREALARELSLTRNALDARISRVRSRLEACVRNKLGLPQPD